MIGDLFWSVATSAPALLADGALLLAALVVGFFPLFRVLPAVSAYVPLARMVAVLAALLICFLLGFRLADEREEAKNLRIKLAAQRADLDIAKKSAADEARRAGEIEATANEQRKRDDDYISTLEAKPVCALGPDDLAWVPNYRAKPGRARSAAGAR